MEIKTKYNLGDTVFFMYDNKIQKGSIRDIETVSSYHTIKNMTLLGMKEEVIREMSITYRIDFGAYLPYDKFSEWQLYDSREELLNSL